MVQMIRIMNGLLRKAVIMMVRYMLRKNLKSVFSTLELFAYLDVIYLY